MSRITQDFIEFWRGPLGNAIDSINEDRTFNHALGVIAIAATVVIGATL